MDFLKDTIEREVKKRKGLYARAAEKADDDDAPGRKKYVRVADIERAARKDEEDKDTATIPDKSAVGTSIAAAPAPVGTQREESAAAATMAGDVADGQAASGTISAEEVVKRLRARGEPARLFGEDDAMRRRRLRTLELTEERADGQQNEFRRAMAHVEAGAMLEGLKRQAHMDSDEAQRRQSKYEMLLAYDVEPISPALLRTDMDRLYTLLFVYLKRLLYEWDDFLASRPDDERQSAEGKLAAATQRQSAEYLKPLFRSLRQRVIQPDIMARITEIARHMIDREYMKANDAYLQLSVGNAPWPIGVTQVGIHSRAARENINADKVAHVLNNETQRKWIQSIKRLIRFAQTKYPPQDLAKMVG
ncbi:hypothetical protein GGF46_000648 [Coemansia sp. RSA 552]|nr:hypothetical protein GGF46_000648 [Coemansia sp. RSA 552]